MTITNDERRAVAARLRDFEQLREVFAESSICAFSDALGVGYMDWEHICARLADLIEPEPKRTCRMLRDDLTDTSYCDVCGERFDSVAQYMAMMPSFYSVTDYEPEYKNAKFCPNCGARVVE